MRKLEGLVEDFLGGGVDLDDEGLAAVVGFEADLPESDARLDVLAGNGGAGAIESGRADSGGDTHSFG